MSIYKFYPTKFSLTENILIFFSFEKEKHYLLQGIFCLIYILKLPNQ